MPAFTSFLNLYKPGGGSTGLILPDEVVDIDRINANMDVIDTFASGWGQAASRSHQFYGPAAGRVGVVGMKRGDTYLESDGSFLTWRYNGAAWVPGQVSVKVQRVAAQSLPTGTFTSVSFDTLEHDLSGGCWAAGANQSRLTVPVKGVYLLTGNGGFATAPSGRIAYLLRKNGGTSLYGTGIMSISGAAEASMANSTVALLDVNDYVDLQIYQESGGALSTASSSYGRPTLSATLLAVS